MKKKAYCSVKKAGAFAMTLLMAGSILAGCGSTGSGSSEEAGSNDADAGAGKTEEEAADLSGSIATNGSTSMEDVMGLLNESFMEKYPDVKITYDATGSGSGIEAVNTGACDIGLASRDLKDEEKDKGLQQTTIAIDGIAIIVNENSKIEDLSIDQIKAIYTGETKDWADVGGDAGEIAPIGREAGSGTRDGFETITGTKDQCKMSQELTSTGAVIEAVKNNPNAIGYASFSSVEGQGGVKAITVDGVKCSEDTIADGSYKVQRNFNLITKKDTELSNVAQAFFDYATSADQAELIKKAGVVPKAQ